MPRSRCCRRPRCRRPAFYEAFLAVLQVYGYVAVPAGKVIKIVPNTDAAANARQRSAEQRESDIG